MQAKLNNYKQMRTLMSSNCELSKVQEAVVLAHFINIQFGLQCVNRNGEKLQYPEQWSKQQEDVYKFQYQYRNITVLFRMVNCDNERISVNFVQEDSEQLYQATIQYSSQDLITIINNYEKNLTKFKEDLENKGKNKEQQKTRKLQPVWRQPNNSPFSQPNRPMIIQPPRNSNNPFDLPFTGGEYVGPDSNIFQGGMGNSSSQYPGPQGMRRPPGARYDPTNPFRFDEDDPSTKDFTGFNEWGVPKGGKSGGFNPFG